MDIQQVINELKENFRTSSGKTTDINSYSNGWNDALDFAVGVIWDFKDTKQKKKKE